MRMQLQRAGRAAVAAAALLAPLLAATAAWGFHAGPTFDKPASAGGTEGMYYAGAPLEHGWTCTQCHQNPEGKIKIHITQPELFNGGGAIAYDPTVSSYDFTVDLVGEHLGKDSPKANYNGLMVQVLTTGTQRPAGALAHADDMVDTFGGSTIVSAGIVPGATQWKFKWFPPGATDGVDGGPPGSVTFYFAAVDGNGADGGPTGGEQDPFNDDVFTVSVAVEQKGVKTGALAPPEPPPGAPDAARPTRGRTAGVAAPVLASMLGLVAVGLSRRRRRR
jgi:hypothetical protein